jgi:3-oxoacyl-[acyl-carrier protein] reductase
MIGETAGAAWPGRMSSRYGDIKRGELLCLADDRLDATADIDGLARLGRIDAVINLLDLGAGAATRRDEGPQRDPQVLAGWGAVVRRTARIVAATGELLRQSRPCGALVNVGWRAAGAAGMSAVTACGSLEVLTQSLATALAPRVRVNAVLAIDLPRARGAPHPGPTGAGMTGTPDHGLGPALFLASSGARHMTGSMLVADAGRSLGFAAFSKPDAEEAEDRV